MEQSGGTLGPDYFKLQRELVESAYGTLPRAQADKVLGAAARLFFFRERPEGLPRRAADFFGGWAKRVEYARRRADEKIRKLPETTCVSAEKNREIAELLSEKPSGNASGRTPMSGRNANRDCAPIAHRNREGVINELRIDEVINKDRRGISEGFDPRADPPTARRVAEYAARAGYPNLSVMENAQAFIEKNEAHGWTVNGRPVADWRLSAKGYEDHLRHDRERKQ